MSLHDARRAPVELEASLAVVGPRAVRVAAEVADLDALAGRRLGPARELRLRDVYLDLPDEPLLRAGRAFRLRRGDGPDLLALKGPGREGEGPGVAREEREAPWGPDAVDVVRRALAAGRPGAGAGSGGARGAAPPVPEALAAAAREGADPLAALREAGFHVLQDRRTRRVRRDVREEGRRVGELAVDEVRYDAGGRPCVHREVEVEAAAVGPAGRRLLGAAVADLEDRFGDDLRRWEPSKLATGLALAELLAEGAAPGWLGSDGSIHPSGYERVEVLLDQRGPGR